MRRIMQLYLESTHGRELAPFASPLDINDVPGSGASGGIVAAFLACFRQCRIVPGMDFV